MGKRQKIIIYVLDVKNCQEEYAAALEFVKAVEDKSLGSLRERKDILVEMADRISIHVGSLSSNSSPRYLEQPLDTPAGEKPVVQGSRLFKEEDAEILKKTDSKIRYQLRIHFKQGSSPDILEESELLHLQYLAMFLKRISLYFIPEDVAKKGDPEKQDKWAAEELTKHLSVFLVPVTKEKYPFKNLDNKIDYSTYTYMSRYLRLLSKRYTGVIYGVDEISGNPVVTSLDFRKNKKCNTNFPLIIIKKDIYQYLFLDSVKDVLKELFELRSNGRFGNSTDENPEKALKDFIAETDLYRIREVAAPKQCQEILNFLETRNSVSLMDFSLFSFLLSEDSVGKYEGIWQLAHEISQGLRQIAQNAIQHAKSKECFFSFYLHERKASETNIDFLGRISETYQKPDLNKPVNNKALEIFMSDLNEEEDMVENFISNLGYEWNTQKRYGFERELSGHLKLQESRDRIAVRNFFSVYADEDAKEEWLCFRQQDLAAHIGLSQFAQTAERCGASVKVISCKYPKLSDGKKIFCKTYSGASDAALQRSNLDRKETLIIPGTQFSILIPVRAWNGNNLMGLGQLSQENNVAENYAAFASFLDYQEKRRKVTMKMDKEGDDARQTDTLNAKEKYRKVQLWKNYWREKFNEDIDAIKGRDGISNKKQYVFNYDFGEENVNRYLRNEDQAEICLKGIISALDIAGGLNEYYLIALTNLPENSIDIFRKICVQLSVKHFPEKLQLYLFENGIADQNDKQALMLGKDFAQAIYNSYILSMEHGIAGFDKKDCEKAAGLKRVLMPKTVSREVQDRGMVSGVCPFNAILKCSEIDKRYLFEKQLKKMAEGSLDEGLIGYKLNNTHIRLESKVHIESFYEMSFLFYRTTIANRLAFMILRKISEGNNVGIVMSGEKTDIVNDSILFYGYASYSKAILTSINEILREYRKQKAQVNAAGMQNPEDRVAIAAFQHNLMLESEEVQMYYDLPKNFPGEIDPENNLFLREKIKIVQIVPISSTLTTFDKMWKKICSSITNMENATLVNNYTVFWVADEAGDMKKSLPSRIEKNYWTETIAEEKSPCFRRYRFHNFLNSNMERQNYPAIKDIAGTPGRLIKSKLQISENKGNMYIYYFIRSTVVWHDPLECELCYPEHVINEVPLVETDPTSTVPAQQIRLQRDSLPQNDKEILQKSYEKFKKLKDCVAYGHICRRHNHYQYYIDTQQYFYNVKDMVKEWLESQSKDALHETGEPLLHIIFSPEHNTNVGFVQYVNTYYFNGLAEIVSLNVDKQFRSNFICEHAALKRMIEELQRDGGNGAKPLVKFYFVDDTVNTGDTLEKANGLLHSLVPFNMYPANLFSRIFVLVDRLSNESKQMYVNNPKDNFLAFLHIDVSNTRTYGDSCIGCKLEQNAMKLYKRSATRKMSCYWSDKLSHYAKKAYDNKKQMETIDKEKSYRMLLFSHILQNTMIKMGNCYVLGDAFDVMLNIALWLLKAEKYMPENIYGYDIFLNDMRNMDGLHMLLKTICRPFFTYDFKIKRQAYTFFIFLTELMLHGKSEEIIPKDAERNSALSYLADNGRIQKMEALAVQIREKQLEEQKSELDFLKDYLLEGLTDMGSTYLMRMQTLKKVYAYLESSGKAVSEENKLAFWNSYEINIHRLVTGNADESRELWLEYMYMTGMEYRCFQKKHEAEHQSTYEPRFLYESITGKQLSKHGTEPEPFYQFCDNLFLQNTGICFDWLEERNAYQKATGTSRNEKAFEDYWKQMRNLDLFKDPLMNESHECEFKTGKEEALFNFLKNEDPDETEQPVNQWYGEFLKYITDVIVEKYGIAEKSINIALLTQAWEDRANENHIQLLDIVKEIINSSQIGISETRYYIKERIVNALKEMYSLEKNGYAILDDNVLNGEKRPYIIAYFDAPGNARETKYNRRQARVFLYISIDKNALGKDSAGKDNQNKDKRKGSLILRLILRDIMMYRYRILRFLEKDFAGEIYAGYAHTIGEKNIISHEKATSHNTTADDAVSLEIFQGENFWKAGYYKVLTQTKAAEWLLLRNYTNGQIAKIFNRSFHDFKDEEFCSNSPMLYISCENNSSESGIFKQKLDIFSKLNLKNENPEFPDKRFELLNSVIDIRYDKSLNNAEFIQGRNGKYYNLEYMKCILIDIMNSAIKFESDRPDYLLRIDRFLEIKKKLERMKDLWDDKDEEEMKLKNKLENSRCLVWLSRESIPNSDVDYLVIRNPVDGFAHGLRNWERHNEIIQHRLRDPLDYADGHMSLLTIKRYIENLDDFNNGLECVFRYAVSEPAEDGENLLYFESKLPILKGENRK